MTTICTDGITVAADSQTTFGQFRQPSLPKIKEKHGRVYAVAGTAGMLDVLADWHNGGANPDKVPAKADFQMLVFDGQTVNVFSNEAPYPVPVPTPCAIGSGWEMAMGVLLHGGSPAKAVELVATLHVNTGLPVQVIDIKEALGLKEPGLRIAKG